MNEIGVYPNMRVAIDKISLYVGVEDMVKRKGGVVKNNNVPSSGSAVKFIKDDILIGNIRPYLRKIWQADEEGGTNGDVVVIRIADNYKDLIIPRFLYHQLASESFFKYDNAFAKGAKMPRGDKSRIMNYEIVIPFN